MVHRPLIAPVIALAVLTLTWPGPILPFSASPALAAQPVTGAWTMYHRDGGHTGFDSTLPNATGATTGWVSPNLDGQVYAEPLFYGGIVYAATLNNTIYALNGRTGRVVWSHHLRTPKSSGWSCGNVSPQGILGTPVIDPAGGRIYAATLGSDSIYRLEGLRLTDGLEQLNTVITTPAGGFDWTIEQERGALAVANGYVYVPMGGRAGDCGSYHGYVFAVPIDGSTVTHYYQTPGQGMGIWAAGGVVVDSSTGKVFVSTGNGTGSGCNANGNGTATYENDAIVRLSSTLAHEDAFYPEDWQNLWCANDQDLGSASPLLISPTLMFASGKWGTGFLLNPASLGGMGGQQFPAAHTDTADVCFGNNSDATFGSFAYAPPYIYVECEGQGLVALNLNTSAPSFSLCDATCGPPTWNTGDGNTYGPPIVAGGIVWVATNGGGLYGFNAATGAPMFQSSSFGINRFVTPSEACGHVFVPAGSVVRSFNMTFTVPPQDCFRVAAVQGPAASPTGRPPVVPVSPAPTPPSR
ncbi:MAG: hypothetical protein AUI15_14765 [Actinobacteria bacterium 13_2_20CM_2_66_6]|nr:MAG: hypothetical protein AUI15_14765 [Actinobacteria bacterium 13_2_20CM_2_66_6]